ncbi:hypothetical protein [Ferruginibacter sp.]
MKIELVTREEFENLNQRIKILEEQILSKKSEAKILKSKDVKILLNCCDSTLSNYKKKNILHPMKVGGTKYYNHEEVYNIINKNKMQMAS